MAAGSRSSLNAAGTSMLMNASLETSPQRLKAEKNAANGGIGVSYSNVVLAGGVNPREGQPAMESLHTTRVDFASEVCRASLRAAT